MAASRLLAVNETKIARECIDEALKLDLKNPEAWVALAFWHAQKGEYAEALAQLDKALELKPDLVNALTTKAEILFGTQRFNEAFAISELLLTRVGDDPQMLFFHAKIAHQAHAYRSEIEALTKLITLAKRSGAPVAGYQIYLGQAYAADSQASPAVEQFTAALREPEITEEQRRFAQESIDRITTRVSL